MKALLSGLSVALLVAASPAWADDDDYRRGGKHWEKHWKQERKHEAKHWKHVEKRWKKEEKHWSRHHGHDDDHHYPRRIHEERVVVRHVPVYHHQPVVIAPPAPPRGVHIYVPF